MPYLNRYNKNEISNQYIGELEKKGKENENEKDLGSIAGNGPGIWPDSLRDQKCGRDYDFRGNYSCNRSHSVYGNDSR